MFLKLKRRIDMDKYVKLEDLNNLLDKLYKEPEYQHTDETYYAGICAVQCELDSLPTIEMTTIQNI